MKLKQNYIGLCFIFGLFLGKHGFSTPTCNLVSDCKGYQGACLDLPGLGRGRYHQAFLLYSHGCGFPLGIFQAAVGDKVMGKEKWRQTKVAARPPPSSSFWMTLLKMVQVVLSLQGSGIRKLPEWGIRHEFEQLIMVFNLFSYPEWRQGFKRVFQLCNWNWIITRASQLCLSP